MLVSIHKLAILLFLGILALQPVKAQQYSLQQCIDSALANNKVLQQSQNTIALSRQRQQEAKAHLLPKLNLLADYKYYTHLPYQLMPQSVFGGMEGQYKEAQFGVPHNINANVQLSMPLYNPQIFGTIQAGAIATDLSELHYEKSAEQLYFEVSNLYYNAQILHHQLRFIDTNMENSQRLLSNMQLLKEQLLATGTDVSKVQLQLEQLKTQKLLISSKYEQLLNALKLSMGLPLNQPIAIDPTITYQEPQAYAPQPSVDFRLAGMQQQLLSTELNSLRNSRLPAISLFGTFGTTGYGYDETPNEFLRFYPLGFAGIQMSQTLFNGTVTQRKIKQKQLELQNSELQLSLLNEQTDMQLANARQQQEVARQSVETSRRQIQLAQMVYTQTLTQQKQGTASLTEVLLADGALREAQQAYLTAVVDYLKALLELKKISGNLSLDTRN